LWREFLRPAVGTVGQDMPGGVADPPLVGHLVRHGGDREADLLVVPAGDWGPGPRRPARGAAAGKPHLWALGLEDRDCLGVRAVGHDGGLSSWRSASGGLCPWEAKGRPRRLRGG